MNQLNQKKIIIAISNATMRIPRDILEDLADERIYIVQNSTPDFSELPMLDKPKKRGKYWESPKFQVGKKRP